MREPGPVGTHETDDARATERLGEALGHVLAPGELVLVRGELGTGKTTFVRGACRALGVAGPVTSPTFTLASRYAGRVAVSHLDLYRLAALDTDHEALLADELGSERVTFVEWPPTDAPALERPAWIVELGHLGGDRRTVRIEAPR